MSTWKDKFNEIESLFWKHEHVSWMPAIKFIRTYIPMDEDKNDVEFAIRTLYVLHNILVEEFFSDAEYKIVTKVLLKYFQDAYRTYSNNHEFLFFIGKILYISEWYFGLNDDSKPIKDRLAFIMQKKAFEMQKDNELYEWAYVFSKGNDVKASLLSKKILSGDNGYLDWLKSKAFPGRYIIQCLS